MKINKTYKSLLEKSVSSMLSAIELYNKPNFQYREETFAILAVNAWELLFKAQLLKVSKYKMASLYELESVLNKNGQASTRKKPKTNRSGNPVTIGIFDVINRLKNNKIKVSHNLLKSIESIVELRDNAIHFHNSEPITKELQELGFACIKNYMHIIKEWKLDIDLSKYNFYLMPLAYVDSKISVDSIITEEVGKYIDFIKNRVKETDNNDTQYDVAISIDINFRKSNNFEEGLPIKYDSHGVPIYMTETNIRDRFPLSYNDIVTQAPSRYSNFKRNKFFNSQMKKIKANNKICFTRKLDPGAKNSQKKEFYSSNIWQSLDKIYDIKMAKI